MIECHILMAPAVVESIPIYTPTDVGAVGCPYVIVHARAWNDPAFLIFCK